MDTTFALVCDDKYKMFHSQFEALVQTARSQKLRVGSNWEHTGHDHECYVKRLSKNIYKICFHTISSHDLD
jgi:hypothetical protein